MLGEVAFASKMPPLTKMRGEVLFACGTAPPTSKNASNLKESTNKWQVLLRVITIGKIAFIQAREYIAF